MVRQVETSVEIDDIIKILNCSKRTFFRKRQELIDAGAIFYQYQGRPPRKRIRAFSSRIMNWMGLKAQKGELL